jgi:hypothetical protein
MSDPSLIFGRAAFPLPSFGPAAAAGGILSGLSTGLSVVSALQQGNATAQGDYYQANNERVMAMEGFVKAQQTNVAGTQKLNDVLSNVRAVRSATGTDASSPTGTAIENRVFSLGGQDIGRQVHNIQDQAEGNLDAANFYQQSALSAMSAAGIGGASAALNGLSGLLKSNISVPPGAPPGSY